MSPIKHSMWRMGPWPLSSCFLLVFPTTADRPIAQNSAYFRSALFIRCALGIERSEPVGLVQRFSFRLSAQTRSSEGFARPPTAAFVTTSDSVAQTNAFRLPIKFIANALGGICLHWPYAPSARKDKGGSEAGNLLL